ncbi:ADP-ribosylglycohydrolase family protein [Dactylosporangium sp. NPDC051485]|uniref:ADP-ribosylglycohydrolase family protein n=1 Tax=Dactylosporangium sp. NPDC051485 TaxID=3154846 RepID=UPI003437AA70
MSKVKAALFGLAFGDALGAPTEFMRYEEIIQRYGARGPRDLPPRGLVTDDTQMTLAVAGGLLSALERPPLTADSLEPRLRGRFLHWWASDENDRAPGNTCLAACAALNEGQPWWKATVRGSKGCGANMRVAPMGLAPGLTDDERAGAAQLQAALTHGHPTGLAASELSALAVRWLLDGLPIAELPAALRARCESQREVYRMDWLGDDLWRRPLVDTPAQFIATGWDECLSVLTGLEDQVRYVGPDTDPCIAGGAGWVAEEALATALYCLLLFPDSPLDALARGAASSGDSDSIASLAGGMAGAVHGEDAWPSDWYERIEYRNDLNRYAAAWS